MGVLAKVLEAISERYGNPDELRIIPISPDMYKVAIPCLDKTGMGQVAINLEAYKNKDGYVCHMGYCEQINAVFYHV